MGTKKTFLVVLLSIALQGCIASSHMVQPVSIDRAAIKKVCVVNNNNLPNEIQGLVNREIIGQGYESFPVSDVAVTKEMECGVYVIYGGTMGWDLSPYLSQLRITVYNMEHDQVGYAEVQSSDGLSLNKWYSGEKLAKEAIAKLF